MSRVRIENKIKYQGYSSGDIVYSATYVSASGHDEQMLLSCSLIQSAVLVRILWLYLTSINLAGQKDGFELDKRGVATKAI